MTLTVLTDDQIRSLLENLTPSELEGFRVALASALHEHSTGIEAETATHQPERTSVHNTTTGATTLFMPSCNSSGNGIKVITLSSATPNPPTSAIAATKPIIRPTGAITLFRADGSPLGLLHASTLTAFRTALASLCLVLQRSSPLATLLVFGCGEQAYWHVRLTLMARGKEVKKVVFVNRRVSASCKEVLGRFENMEKGVREREGWQGCVFGALTRDEQGYESRLEGLLREADVVFCCTPATEPLFDAGVWETEEGKRKGRLVVAIGSYTPEMREMPAELVRRAIGKGEMERGVVVVDTIHGALTEAGELIEVGVKPEQMVELGELAMQEKIDKGKRGNLEQWLKTGNVIYKSVGLGLMDLSIGMHIVGFAKDKGVGTNVQGF
ncbi:hypothetical protein VTI74DRAFT_9816 [Chaetomium olivicolor]